MRKYIGAAVLALALIATLGSGDEDTGDSGGSTPTTVSSGGSETTAAPGSEGETSAPGGGETTAPASGGDADEVDDVVITACEKDALAGWATASIEVTNNSSEPSTYFIDIAFESPDGSTQIGTGATIINGLGPGQKKVEDVSSLEDAGDQEFICRVASVERMAA